MKITVNFFLGKLSAFLSGLFILLLGVLFAMIVVGNTVGFITRDKDSNMAITLGQLFAHTIFLIFLLYLSIAFGRFLLRAMPPRLSGRIRFGALILPILIGIVLTALLATPLLGFVMLNMIVDDRLWLILIVFLMTALVWFSGVCIPVFIRHLKPRSFLDKPFTLFLRRFSNFSDRAVMFLILRKATTKKPVLFLVPTRSRAGDWNPFLLGFTGMRFLHPFRSVPFIIKVSDDEWKQAAELLIQRAQTIIIDVSQSSEAIETEFQMIDEALCWHKTTFLKEKNAKAHNKIEEKLPIEAFQINYTKSWMRALLRLILGAIFVYFVWAFIILVVAVESSENMTVVRWSAILAIPFCIWIYLSFFWRASIDGESKQLLKTLLSGQQSRILATDIQIQSSGQRNFISGHANSPADDGN